MADTMFVDDSTKDIAKDMEEVFNKGGMKAVIEKVKQIEDGWKTVSVNVGVIGKSGVGKSSFINAYRNLEDDDEYAAPVGVTQSTMKFKAYPDPINPNIILYCVPGVGTTDFPRSTYLKDSRVGIDKYDVVIIITSLRFTEDELWLYEKMACLGKSAFLVRTKVMQDVRHEQHRKKKKYGDTSDQDVIKEVIDQYKSEMSIKTRVYYIDSHERDHPNLEFDDLLKAVVSSVISTKADAILYSLRVFTPLQIEAKVNRLKKRKWFISCISAVGAASPIPGLSAPIDISLVLSEAIFYREQLGLDGNKVIGPMAECVAEAAINAIIDTWKVMGPEIISSLLKSEAAESVSKLLIPVLGSIVSACISYGSTAYLLNSLLDRMAKDAIKLNHLLIDSESVGLK